MIPAFLLALIAAFGADADALRMNQIQVIGTHNSYHLAPPPEKLSALTRFAPDAESWNYEHKPLPEQLDLGVRSFELDLYIYPDGWEVFHVPNLDDGSSCPRFVECLSLVKEWSGAHPNHVPISFLLEVKEEERILSRRKLAPLDAAALDRIDAEIRSVFPAEKLITPDDVRGDAATLAEAVRTKGWPLLREARGKVFFILHERGKLRDLYTEGRPSLEGRAMFVNSDPGRPDFAAIVMDNPKDSQIPERVREGAIIRTRADAGLRKDAEANLRRRDAAFASGAQILSTDYPPGEADPATGYVVGFPEGAPARINPVNAEGRTDLLKE